MQKSGRLICLAVAVSLLAACGGPISGATQDLLFLRSPRGIAVVEPGAAAPAFRDAAAVPSGDWSTVVRSGPWGDETRLVALDPRSGIERWERDVAGDLTAKIVSEDGSLVALGPSNESYYLFGRRRTTMVIAGTRVSTPRTITLKGNFEPEAFSVDGKSLFVIKYLPARAPSRYQVRRLDLITERVHNVYTADGHLQEAMQGTARIQTASPDGRRLYTLYTLGSNMAFIHVLSLDELWAHCIDLPKAFGTAAESKTALTVSPDGKRLYVANSETESVAEIDTQQLRVVGTTPITTVDAGRAHAVHDSGSTLYVGSGLRVSVVDTGALTQKDFWTMPERIRGLQVSRDAQRLYVGLRDRVAILDAATGEILDTIDPPGIGRITQFGPVMRSLDTGRAAITCAC